MFTAVVSALNQTLDVSSTVLSPGGARPLTSAEQESKLGSVGILDFQGFERLPLENSLEQLLINVANEALTDLFFRTVFEDEAEVYYALDLLTTASFTAETFRNGGGGGGGGGGAGPARRRAGEACRGGSSRVAGGRGWACRCRALSYERGHG